MVWILGLLWLSLAWAQDPSAIEDTASPAVPTVEEAPVPDRPLVVAVSAFPPMVLADGEASRGFSVDLWRALERVEGLRSELRVYPDVGAKLDAVRRGEADVAIGGITITLEREQQVDFSLPVFRTGLDILVPARAPGLDVQSWLGVFTPGRIAILVGFALLIVVAGHLVWWAEQGDDAFDDHYFPGVIEGMYWAIVTASTVGYGDKAPVRWPGRAVAALVIIISLPMFAIFTAELTSAFTVATLSSGIDGPGDLDGKRVGVVRGTTSDAALSGGEAVLVRFDTVGEAVAALDDETLDAVVHDAPSLHHHARLHDGDLRQVGNLFEPQHYGLAVAPNSPLREAINRGMLELRERGEWEAIRQTWFPEGIGQ